MHRDDVGTRLSCPSCAHPLSRLRWKNALHYRWTTSFSLAAPSRSDGRNYVLWSAGENPARVLIDRGHRDCRFGRITSGKIYRRADEKVRLRLEEEQANEGVWLVKEEQ